MSTQNLFDGTEWEDQFCAWTMCVGSYPALSANDIALEWPYRGKHMKESMVLDVRLAGFDVLPDPREGRVHAMLSMRQEPSREAWERLRPAFGPELDNPAYLDRE